MQNYILAAALAYLEQAELTNVTVTVNPPPESCCSTEWDDSTCNPIQDAIDKASTSHNTTIEI